MSSLLSRTNNFPSTIQVDNASMDRKTYIPSDLNIDSALTTESTPSRTSLVSPPDIDKVIQGFQHELDTLSRSFDLLSSHSKRSRSQNSETRSQRFHSTPVPQPPPPPSARPPAQNRRTDADSHSTSHRLNLSRADETVFTQTTTKTPKPVETPATSPRRRTYAEIPHQDRNLFPSSSSRSTNDLQATVQTMQEMMNEQNATILKLKRENNELRKRLLEAQYPRETTREPMLESSNRHRNNYQTPYTRSRYSEGRNHNDTTRPDKHYLNSNSYYEDEMKPSVSSLTSLPRQDDDENTLETHPPPQSRLGNTVGAKLQTDFTPGTKFVAELSKFMTLPPGQSVPLSVIIDRNWDKLKYHMRDESGSGL